MTKPMIRIHNTELDEVIDREMTDDEFKIHKERVAKFEAEEAAIAARNSKRQELLVKLGLTADEAATLLG